MNFLLHGKTFSTTWSIECNRMFSLKRGLQSVNVNLFINNTKKGESSSGGENILFDKIWIVYSAVYFFILHRHWHYCNGLVLVIHYEIGLYVKCFFIIFVGYFD